MQHKIEELVEFNPALVYAFEPESSRERLNGSNALIDSIVPEANQHQDMLEAYLYAQNTILPFIRENGFEAVDEDRLIDWIKTLHSLIGKSLLEGLGMKAGDYSTEVVTRWHHGFAIMIEFCKFLSSQHACKTILKFISFLKLEFQLDEKDGLAFTNLLLKLQKDKTIVLSDCLSRSLKRFASSPLFPGVMAMHKLSELVNSKTISVEDKKIADKVVKICMFPEEISGAMKGFAKTTLLNYKHCDKTDLQQISHFLAQTFYHLTDIHPYPNGNGRVATCWINILIRTLSFPSILLRQPGDNADKNSLYSKAIDQIDETLLPLQELISQRIVIAQKVSFCDETLKKIIILRVALSELIKRIHSKYPAFDIDSIKNEIELISLGGDKNQLAICTLLNLINIAAKHEIRLDEQCKKPAVVFSLQPKLNKDELKQLILTMEKLTGEKKWLTNQDKGLVMWLELPNGYDRAFVIKELLQKIGFMDVKLDKRRDNNTVDVIKCTNIKHNQLSTLVQKKEELIFTMDI